MTCAEEQDYEAGYALGQQEAVSCSHDAAWLTRQLESVKRTLRLKNQPFTIGRLTALIESKADREKQP